MVSSPFRSLVVASVRGFNGVGRAAPVVRGFSVLGRVSADLDADEADPDRRLVRVTLGRDSVVGRSTLTSGTPRPRGDGRLPKLVEWAELGRSVLIADGSRVLETDAIAELPARDEEGARSRRTSRGFTCRSSAEDPRDADAPVGLVLRERTNGCRRSNASAPRAPAAVSAALRSMLAATPSGRAMVTSRSPILTVRREICV